MMSGLKYAPVVLVLFFHAALSQRLCSTAKLLKCIQVTGIRQTDAFANGLPTGLSPDKFCRKSYPLINTCLGHVGAACGSSRQDQIVKAALEPMRRAFRYMCTDGFSMFNKHYRCLGTPALLGKLRGCGAEFKEKTRRFSVGDNFCKLVTSYRTCLASNVNERCGTEAARFYDAAIGYSVEPILERYFPNCNVRAPLDIYCVPNPCRNGGRCYLRSRRPVCHCINGYTGSRCHYRSGSRHTSSRYVANKSGGMPSPTTMATVSSMAAVFLLRHFHF